ncbi:MAG: 5'-Nucleotidase domain protein, partial [Bacteroidetes bacterium]|nr:5'-Nucleotidase domain protein [Bacteroidota bacterium]
SDEVGSTAKTMKVWDIQNLPTFTQLTPFIPSPTTVIHNVHGRGYYVYIAHYKAGVFVADVHNPTAITNAGGFNTYRGGGFSASYAGCWGVYPYFPSGRWIASDTQTGLYVMRLNGLAPRIRSPLLQPVAGDTVVQNTPKTFRWRRAASKAEDPHYYQLHIFGLGVDTLLRSNDTSYVLSSLAGLQSGQTYRWHVWIKDEFTSVSSQDTFRFVYRIATGVGERETAPRRFSLSQNYPNPFNPATVIRYAVPSTSRVMLKVLNILGEEVATLFDELKQAGEYEARFDGAGLPSGLYFYRMSTSNGFVRIRKMVLLK